MQHLALAHLQLGLNAKLAALTAGRGTQALNVCADAIRASRVAAVSLKAALNRFLDKHYAAEDVEEFKRSKGEDPANWAEHSQGAAPSEVDVLRIRHLVRFWVSYDADREDITQRMLDMKDLLAPFRPTAPVRVYRNEKLEGEDGWDHQYDFASAWSTSLEAAKAFEGEQERKLVTALAQPEDILVSVPVVDAWARVYDLGLVDAEEDDEVVVIPHPSFEHDREEVKDEPEPKAKQAAIIRLFHVGRLDEPRKAPDFSYEGSGLSCSKDPDKWRAMARLGDAPVWELTKSNPKFYRFERQTPQAIKDWCVENGWLIPWDDGYETYHFGPKGEAWWNAAFNSEVNHGRCLMFAQVWWAEAQGGFDGVFWPGSNVWVIFQNMIPSWQKVQLPKAKEAAAEDPMPTLKTDNPGGEWLEQKKEDAASHGRHFPGLCPKVFGPVTGSFRPSVVLIPVTVLAAIPGARNEQQQVRPQTIEHLTGEMSSTGRLPQAKKWDDTLEDYVPFIMVDQWASPWVNEGNHRIMAAKQLGWDYLPVEIRYFCGSEAIRGGMLSPMKVLRYHKEALAKGYSLLNYGKQVVKQAAQPVHATHCAKLLQPKVAALPDLTALPAFKAWFGNSKIVDAQGHPLVCYHGTRKRFVSLNPGKARTTVSRAIFFTPDQSFANYNATRADEDLTSGHPQVLPVYLKAENPWDFRDPRCLQAAFDWMAEQKMVNAEEISSYSYTERKFKEGYWACIESVPFQGWLQAQGYDGFFCTERDNLTIGVYSPYQIKSALGNNGKFNPAKKDIRAAVGDLGDGDSAVTTDETGQFWGHAGAGCIFVAEDTGRVMLNYRSADVNEPHSWGVWGGAIDHGEDPATAAQREIHEETGYTGPVRLEQLFVFSKGNFKYTTFLAHVPKEFKPTLDWESDGFRWCAPGQWPTPLHYGLKAALPALEARLKSTPKQASAKTAAVVATPEEATKAGFKLGPLYHGTNATFDEFEVGHAHTAADFYFTPKRNDAAGYGSRILVCYLKVHRMFNMGNLEDLGQEQYRVLEEVFNDVGNDWGFEDFDSFMEVVTEGRMYEKFSTSQFQDDVLREIFSKGYDCVHMVDAGFCGFMSQSYVVEDPSQVAVVQERKAAKLLQPKQAAAGITLYHGTRSTVERPSVKHKGILWTTEQPQVATNYANAYWRKEGDPVTWAITLKPGVQVIDLSDLSNPLIRTIKDDVSRARAYTFGPIQDDGWARYADFGLLETEPWIIKLLRSNRIMAVRVRDISGHTGGDAADSVAILSDQAIASMAPVNGKRAKLLRPKTAATGPVATNAAGAPIHETEAGVANFWRWFGASKTVNAKGQPMVFHHGTPKGGFDAFDPGALGTNTGSPSSRMGFFFTPDLDAAKHYAQMTDPIGTALWQLWTKIESVLRARGLTGKIYTGYSEGSLFMAGDWRSKLPKDATTQDVKDALGQAMRGRLEDYHRLAEQFRQDIERKAKPKKWELAAVEKARVSMEGAERTVETIEEVLAGTPELKPDWGTSEIKDVYLRMLNPFVEDHQGRRLGRSFAEVISDAKAGGHDGAVILNTEDPRPMDVYIVFEPTQIKGVENQGAFSAGDARLVASQRDGVAVPVTLYEDTPAFAVNLNGKPWPDYIKPVEGKTASAEPTIGFNVNDDEMPWTELILSGKKTIETRNSPSLSPHVGERVGIVRTSKQGMATLVGTCTLGEPIIYKDVAAFQADSPKHQIQPGSSFDLQPGTVKYGYPLLDVQPCEPRVIRSQGRVFRKLAAGESAVMDAPPDITKLVEQADREVPLQAPQRVDPTSTPEFKAWFGTSKVVDRSGRPKVVYHGSTHAFDKFDMANGNEEGFYGKGFYFTDSTVDVNENYAKDNGADLTYRIEQRAEDILQKMEDDAWHTFEWKTEERDAAQAKAKELAKKEIAGSSLGMVYLTYLRMLKPVVVKPSGGTYFEGGHWDPKDDDRFVESRVLGRLYAATLRACQELGCDGSKVWEVVSNATEGDMEGFTAYQFDQAVRHTDEVYDVAGGAGPLLSRIYQLMGFDGVIMDAEDAFSNRGKGMKMSPGTTHYIVWNPRQVKSALGNSGAFSPRSPRMTAKLLQPKQAMVAFHGTPHDFEQFKLKHVNKGEGHQAYGWGLYFTDLKEVADYYRLTISNPLSGLNMTYKGQPVDPTDTYGSVHDPVVAEVLGDLAEARGNPTMALQLLKERLQTWEDGPADMWPDNIARTKEAIQRFPEIVRDTQIPLNPGITYEVDIPDGPYLLWDSPFQDQDPLIQKAVKELGKTIPYDYLRADLDDPEEPLGFNFVYALAKLVNKGGSVGPGFGGRPVSMILRKHGIRGTKFLDQDSRARGEGTFNYVIFNDKDVKVVKKHAAHRAARRAKLLQPKAKTAQFEPGGYWIMPDGALQRVPKRSEHHDVANQQLGLGLDDFNDRQKINQIAFSKGWIRVMHWYQDGLGIEVATWDQQTLERVQKALGGLQGVEHVLIEKTDAAGHPVRSCTMAFPDLMALNRANDVWRMGVGGTKTAATPWQIPSYEQAKWIGCSPKLYAKAKAHLEALSFPLTLYRAVKLKSEADLHTHQAGIFWTDQLDRAGFYTPAGRRAPGERYILRAEVGPEVIDWPSTFNANCEPQGNTGTREQEIKLNMGAPVVLNGIMGPGETEFRPLALPVTAAVAGLSSTQGARVQRRAKLLRPKFASFCNKVFIDMDGVLADYLRGAAEAGVDRDEFLNVPGAFRNLELLPGAAEAMTKLQRMVPGSVHILSKPADKRWKDSCQEKRDWMAEHFPSIPPEHILLVMDKGAVGGPGDLLIDDNPTWNGVPNFRGQVIHFTSPRSWELLFKALEASNSQRPLAVSE